MTTPELPPLMIDQRKVDAEHLRLLSVFHYVAAGLSLLGLAFIGLHYAVMSTVMNNPGAGQGPQGGPPPEFFAMAKWFYLIAAVAIVASGVLNLFSAVAIQERRLRTFSMVVAALNCLNMPLGTALGAFTFVVLLRDSVRQVYED